MPHRYLGAVEPIVRHGIRELRDGATVGHTLTEVALMSALVGAGATPSQAIRRVEQFERQLIGMGPWEQAERYHQPATTAPMWSGKPMQQPMTMAPWGKQQPMGVSPWSMQQPMSMGPWSMPQQSRTMRGDWGH